MKLIKSLSNILAATALTTVALTSVQAAESTVVNTIDTAELKKQAIASIEQSIKAMPITFEFEQEQVTSALVAQLAATKAKPANTQHSATEVAE